MDGSTDLDRRTFFKGAGLMGAALAVPGLVAGCGDGGASQGAGTQTLEFWWNPSVESADQMQTWMNGVIKEFVAANQGTAVESTTQPSEQLASNFRTACQSRTGSDLQHQYSGPYTLQFVWEKCIAPLDGTLDAETMGHVLPPQALDIYKFQGKTWALPWYNAPIPLMYNKALFTKAGLDPEKPPATMDELISAAAALRKAGITPWGYGVKNLTGIGNFSGMFNTQNLDDPKELLPVVLGEQKYTDPKFSQWLTWVKQMIDAEVFNPDVTSLEYADAMNMFLAGKCAFAITSSLTKFEAALKGDLGVMAPPKCGSGALAGRVHFNSHPLFITSFSEKKELAAKFLAFLHRPEALNGMYKATGFFPADDRFDSSTMNSPQDQQLWELQSNQSTIGYQNFWPSKMDRENSFLAVQAVFSGTAPEKAAEEVEQRLGAWRQSAANELKNFRAWSGS
ncbi:ABC transporter substrate-binding protein [Oryzobacter sp. R7]|uniref:ABC transporter substrate-binding protein n=1 Tax=Oryzobacter faecalis TaxID=3388656 RepID=UPI00398CA248